MNSERTIGECWDEWSSEVAKKAINSFKKLDYELRKDMLSECYLRSTRIKLSKYEHYKAGPKAAFYRVCTNLVIDKIRASKTKKRSGLPLFGIADQVFVGLRYEIEDNLIDRILVEQFLSSPTMNDKYSTLMSCIISNNCDLKDVAKDLGKDLKDIKSDINKIKSLWEDFSKEKEFEKA